MRHGRVLGVLVVVIAVAALFVGLSMENTYSVPQHRLTCISSETFSMPENSTTYKSLSLNESGSYYIVVYANDASNTVFSSALTDANLQKWLKGQFAVSWDGASGNGDFYNLPVPCQAYPYDVSSSSNTQIANIVFWNSRNISQQVNVAVYEETLVMDQSGLNLATMITAASSVVIVAVAAFFAVKHRASLKNFKMTRKKALVLVVSVILLVFGVYLANTYSSPVNAQVTLAHGIVNVPAKNYNSIAYVEGSAGIYLIQISSDKGTVQAFENGENSTFMHWSNGTVTDIRSWSRPDINASSGQTGVDFVNSGPPTTVYLILSNIDSYSKNVSYIVTYSWTYSNNFAYIAGVALTAIGAILLAITLLGNKLRAFNRALENQE